MPLWVHVVDINARTRRTSRAEFIQFSGNGSDCRFYFDTGSVDANGECPVVAFGRGRDNIIIAHSFVEFVERAVAGRLVY